MKLILGVTVLFSCIVVSWIACSGSKVRKNNLSPSDPEVYSLPVLTPTAVNVTTNQSNEVYALPILK